MVTGKMTTESQMMDTTTSMGENNIVTSSHTNASPMMAPAEKPKKFSGLIVNDAFQVAGIVEKLPPLWKDFKNYLKHKRKEMTVEDLIIRLHIEENNKAAERRSKGNSTMNQAHIVEDGQNNSNKRKKVEHGSNQPKKKFKGKCFNCGKIDHNSTDCRALKKDKKKDQANMIESNKEYDDLCAMFTECNLILRTRIVENNNNGPSLRSTAQTSHSGVLVMMCYSHIVNFTRKQRTDQEVHAMIQPPGEKVNPTIINNDARVSLYMMDVDADGFRPILRINVVDRSFEEPMNSSLSPPRCRIVDNDLIDYESDGDHPMNMEDGCEHMKAVLLDSKDAEEDCRMGSQPVYIFSNGINFYHDQTFVDKKQLKLLLDGAAVRQSFDYCMEKSCTKFLKAKCLSPVVAGCCRKCNCKEHHSRDTKAWICLLAFFFHMVELLNPGSSYSIMVNQIDGLFVYFFLAFISCIRGYAHMRKVIAIDGTHLYGKYGGVLLSAVAQDTENHVFPIAFCVVVLMDEREYPVSYIVNSIAKKFGEKFRERYAYVDGKKNIFVPCTEKILRDNKSANDSLYVTNPNGVLDQYMVFRNGVTTKVNLLERSCSCRKFDLVKMPCEHAMVALRAKYGDGVGYGNSIYEYYSPIYKAASYLLAYSEAINVVPP
ncbi:putative phosphoserine aminotransferase, chloroplastic-like [Capsicum annuum]|nr:putative phosphoserine aminotransferase, chloroplastic-like [Capsicum annuum]